MTAIEERFHAAVNVIKGLPKNGPYQPSTAMMLKFYGLFKQATEGPCEQKKPGFWDVVGRAKWDAWSSNRQLSKEQAMQRYVDSLKEIIETMSFTENVQNFVGSLSGLENISLDELDLVSPGLRELAESHPNSPFNSRTNSPQHGTSTNATAVDGVRPEEQNNNINNKNSNNNKNAINIAATKTLTNGHDQNNELANTIVQENGYAESVPMAQRYYDNQATANINAHSDDEYDDPFDINHDVTVAITRNTELLEQILRTIAQMNIDINAVNQRIGGVEKSLQEVRSSTQQQQHVRKQIRRYPNWWPFPDISPTWFVLLVLWPFVVQRFSRLLDGRKN